MEMTFNQYITNPMGKNNTVLSAAVREATRRDYTTRFNNILLRENGRIDYWLYKGKGAVYFLHIKIPSEVVKNFYYDVVLKFTGSPEVVGGMHGLDKYKVQFYSNDPAFVFTYAHVFRTNNLFIKELSGKMSRRALKEKPKEKNANELVGYVKSLFFAYLFMEQRGLFKPAILNVAQSLDINYLVSQIEDADSKIDKRQVEGAKVSQKKKEKISDDTYKKLRKSGVSDDQIDSAGFVRTTDKVKKVKKGTTSKFVSKSNSIKGIKKTKRF